MQGTHNSLSREDSHPLPVPSDQARWFAVCTLPRHEKAVAERLEFAGIEGFCPTAVSENQWKDRRALIRAPIFPGYVFTRTTLSARFRVLGIPGITRILSFGGKPAVIDDHEMQAVRLCSEFGTNCKPHEYLSVGERVRIRSGLLSGVEGFILRMKNHHRVVVSISMINRSLAVEIDRAVLESVRGTAQ
jgi:transcription antitermination factor NusG